MTGKQVHDCLIHCGSQKCHDCDLNCGDGFECLQFLLKKAAKVIRGYAKTIKELREENEKLCQKIEGGNKDGLV